MSAVMSEMDNTNTMNRTKTLQEPASQSGHLPPGDAALCARALASAAVRNRLLEHYTLQTLEGSRTVTEIEMQGFDQDVAPQTSQVRSRPSSAARFLPAHAE
jgi:hypothetical protein